MPKTTIARLPPCWQSTAPSSGSRRQLTHCLPTRTSGCATREAPNPTICTTSTTPARSFRPSRATPSERRRRAPTPPALLTADRERRHGDAHVRPQSRSRFGAHCWRRSRANGAAPSEVDARRRSVVTLTLAAALADGEAASVSYTPPEEGALQGAGGIAAAAFTQAVVNRTDRAPVAESGEVNAAGATLTITFSEALSEASDATPAITAFSNDRHGFQRRGVDQRSRCRARR